MQPLPPAVWQPKSSGDGPPPGCRLKRPLAWLGFSYFVGLFIASFLTVSMVLMAAGACLCLLLVCVGVARLRRDQRVLSVLFGLLAAGMMYAGWEMLVYQPVQQWDGQTAALTVETVDWMNQEYAGDSGSVAVRVVAGDLPAGTGLTLWLPVNNWDPAPYDTLTGRFVLSTPSDSTAGQTRGYSKSQGRYLSAAPEDWLGATLTHTVPEQRPFLYHILTWRRYAQETLRTQPSMADVSGLMAGIAFGDKSGVDAQTYANFCDTGVVHVMSVSGLHTTFVAQGLLALLLLLRVRRRIAALIATGGVALFVALTGFTVSGLRAGCMCAVLFVGMAIGRQYDGLNALGLALLLITGVNPYAVNDVGLLLSAAGTLGILVLYPLWTRRVTDKVAKNRHWWVRWLRRPCTALGVTLSATLPILPIQAWSFGYISLISPVANVLVVFAATGAMLCVWLGVLLSLVPAIQPVTTVVFNVGKWIARYMDGMTGMLAQVPYAAVPITSWLVAVWLGAAPLAVGLACHYGGRRQAYLAGGAAALVLAGILVGTALVPPRAPTVTVLKAQDSTAVLLAVDDHYGLITLGERSATRAAQRELERRQATQLDFWALPNVNDGCAFSAMLVSRQVPTDLLVIGEGSKYRHTLDALATVQRQDSLTENMVVWADWRLTLLESGCVYLERDRVRVLICPTEADLAALPAEYRTVDLAVFTETLPHTITALDAGYGVLCSSEKTWENSDQALPAWFPVYGTQTQPVTFTVGGDGLQLS